MSRAKGDTDSRMNECVTYVRTHVPVERSIKYIAACYQRDCLKPRNREREKNETEREREKERERERERGREKEREKEREREGERVECKLDAGNARIVCHANIFRRARGKAEW